MVSSESPALSSPSTDLEVRRRRGLELFCLSCLALFLELMVIRWEPAVVRLIAYYANLMLISSFLGLGVGAIVGKAKKSLFGWLPALLLINVVWLGQPRSADTSGQGRQSVRNSESALARVEAPHFLVEVSAHARRSSSIAWIRGTSHVSSA